MAEFTCSVCGTKFNLPDEVLAKYPNWVPKYCREHSPKKNKSASSVGSNNISNESSDLMKKYPPTSMTATVDMTPEEVLAKFKPSGPTTGIFTDGSSRPNPGPGGWGFVQVRDGEIVAKKCGSDNHTTNNRMEMTALIEVLKSLPSDSTETIYSDSDLSVNILTKWVKSWEKNGWKRKTGEIENLDLVKEAYALMKEHPQVKLEWIKAHCGWLWNEYANALAISWIWNKENN